MGGSGRSCPRPPTYLGSDENGARRHCGGRFRPGSGSYSRHGTRRASSSGRRAPSSAAASR